MKTTRFKQWIIMVIIVITCLFIGTSATALESMADKDLKAVVGQAAAGASVVSDVAQPVTTVAPTAAFAPVIVPTVQAVSTGIEANNQRVNIQSYAEPVKMVQHIKAASFFGIFF